MNIKTPTPLKQLQPLTLPLSSLKGVGPKRAALLGQKGLRSVLDLLFYLPFRYEDRTRILPIKDAEEGRPVLVTGTVLSGREERFYPSRKSVYKIRMQDKGYSLELIWFHYKRPHLAKFSTPGTGLLAFGRVQISRGRRQMIHPEVSLVPAPGSPSTEALLGFSPVYPAIPGIPMKVLRSMMRTALDKYLGDLVDPIPEEISTRLDLPPLAEALGYVHFPPRESRFHDLGQWATPYHQRLVFDRLFLVMLTMAFRKKARQRRPGPPFGPPPTLTKDLERIFPFKLTPHQMRAIRDVVQDFTAGKCMNRLVLGDVGCGKTVVAAAAAYISVYNNHQVAIMVPTQELANQHFEYFLNLSPKTGFRPALLTGRLRKAQRLDLYGEIADGSRNLVIGTQSLIQEGLRFARLGLVVIDEQQRFGVRHRALMDSKGENPHLLVLTATPIPRTLAIIFYGDMDLSFIEGPPEGRTPPVTRLVGKDEKRKVFEILKERMSAGQQALVICPVIEGSEDVDLKNAREMARKLKKIFSPSFRIGLVHGRLPPDEREAVMNDFRKGLIHLLVGTTVIEVGVHVPKATVMVIEHPERFGLAQLHQLRGRVGRGTEKGLCLLMVSDDLPEASRARLRILAQNQDGFEIARHDLMMRGQGELVGTKQAGVGDLDFAEMVRDPELLRRAREEANRLIEADPALLRPQNAHLKLVVYTILERPLDL